MLDVFKISLLFAWDQVFTIIVFVFVFRHIRTACVSILVQNRKDQFLRSPEVNSPGGEGLVGEGHVGIKGFLCNKTEVTFITFEAFDRFRGEEGSLLGFKEY